MSFLLDPIKDVLTSGSRLERVYRKETLPGFARTTLTPGRTVKNVAGSWATNADLSRTGWSRTG